MELTPQQTAFVDAVVHTKDNVCLRARAGTGKTSTILVAADAYAKVFPTHEVVICVFGKAIQTEISDKLRARNVDWKKLQAVTTHSLGLNPIRYAFKSVKVDDKKIFNLVKAQNNLDYEQFFGSICEMVHLAKVEGFGFFDDVQIGDTHAWYRLAEHYNVNGFERTDDRDRVVACAQYIYKLSINQTDVIDFDDMVLFPLVHNLRVFGKDVIYLDEAQDTSRTRRALVKKFLKRTGRLIIVGDDRQAIMGFAGAGANALDDLIEETNAKVLPLTTTWRCPKSVVKLARSIVPDIEAAAGAAEGTVTTVDALPTKFNTTDAILCRNTAPLVTTAYALIRKGVGCKVEGREIGSGLLRIVDRWSTVKTVAAFLTKLEDYSERETQKAIAKGKDSKVQEIADRQATLVAICDAVKTKGLHSLDDVRAFIRDLFADHADIKNVLTLCTYHRSKGREWPRVMLLEHSTRCPSPWAKKDWEKRQESNLAYVAITRAQQDLIFVG
jgi:DNA helicase-2/ATP-dependent DNA helicase PcrA